MIREFIKEDLEFYLPDSFKGLSKQYILDKIFNIKIQKNWKPSVGDVIVGFTGNVFVISGRHQFVPELGGDLFFFGGHGCNRDSNNKLNSTACYLMNEKGETSENCEYDTYNVSSFSDYRFVPYPHEIKLKN
jgi:hypothetical protein